MSVGILLTSRKALELPHHVTKRGGLGPNHKLYLFIEVSIPSQDIELTRGINFTSFYDFWTVPTVLIFFFLLLLFFHFIIILIKFNNSIHSNLKLCYCFHKNIHVFFLGMSNAFSAIWIASSNTLFNPSCKKNITTNNTQRPRYN